LVAKCGGAVALEPDALCRDVAALISAGVPVVLVHGGSADIDRLAERLGQPHRRLVAPDGLSTRHTDSEALQTLILGLCGITKPRLLSALQAAGVPAVGLTGIDAGLVRARRKSAHRVVRDGRVVIVRDNHSGRIERVDARVLRSLLAAGLVPVISPPALAEDGAAVNVDADRVAAAVAAALDGATLLLLTDTPGVLADPGDSGSTISELTLDPDALPDCAGGGMRMKLNAAGEALRAGVGRVVIGDGRPERPIRQALDNQGSTRVTLAPAGGHGGLR
jgi:acetylglutamate/LysW-gamma-L-alpha-aminoadipate kinase